MRRVSLLFALAAIVLLGLLVVGGSRPSLGAQDATPGAMTGHPLVGSWVVIDPGVPDDTPSVSVFTSDGIMMDAAAEGPGAGSWEATGSRTAAVTLVVPIVEEEFAGTAIIRGTIEVDQTGDTFTSPYSYTVVAADGTVVDAGQGMVEATRIAVEPIEAEGTPHAAVPTWTVLGPEVGTPVAVGEAAEEATPT